MSPRDLLISQLPIIDELVRIVARRYRLTRADADEFGSVVRLRLVEDDYAVLRKFRGQSSLRTFLTVVIARLCMDYLAHQWGKWRPSAQARRLGPGAIRLETLVFRDGLSCDEACQRLIAADPRLTAASLMDLIAQLPPRRKRRFVDDTNLAGLPSATPAPDARVAQECARDRSRALAAAIAGLDPEDRRLVRLRFVDDLSVAEIARQSGADQAALYRRLNRLLRVIRVDMEKQGVASAAG
jgi:RNA polymerase sigma factor (sigma-70 family)